MSTTMTLRGNISMLFCGFNVVIFPTMFYAEVCPIHIAKRMVFADG